MCAGSRSVPRCVSEKEEREGERERKHEEEEAKEEKIVVSVAAGIRASSDGLTGNIELD